MKPTHLLLPLLPITLAQAPPTPSPILLSSIKALTLRSASLTTSRRTPPIPQLTCVGGSACALHTIDVMRCTNAGSEYGKEDVQWTCRAELPEEFRLGSTEVVCEGFEGPEDEWVLKGSCGVEYRLVLTERGRERFGDGGEKGGFGDGERGGGGEKGLGERAFEVVFWAIFLGIVALILRSVFTNNGGGAVPHPRRRRTPNTGGHGYDDNNDNDDGHDDPPPPYTPHAKPSPRSSTSSNPSSWRPGFFTGAATGAAAGYAMGSRNAPQQGQAGPSNWFGGGGGQSASRPSFRSGGASSSSPPGGLSGATYESTGFGGSRRR
ncbi:hypothetical protein WHR41_00692 [Cladosporium halotolerans]|uniref:Store-operated calcium entry-associated regulatory factor n=1 Tax=Cladosporium halotolerans TaxID=1052096 RepID=A0AB34L0G0_9PEZI